MRHPLNALTNMELGRTKIWYLTLFRTIILLPRRCDKIFLSQIPFRHRRHRFTVECRGSWRSYGVVFPPVLFD